MAENVSFSPSECGVTMPTELLTISDVAALLKINKQVAARRVKAGLIPGFRLNGTQWRIHPQALEAWLAAQAGLPSPLPRKIGRPRTDYGKQLAQQYPDVFGADVIH